MLIPRGKISSAKVEAAVRTETDVCLDCFIMTIEFYKLSLLHSVRVRDYNCDLQHVNEIKYNTEYIKVKVKCYRYRPAVAQRVGRGIALLFHDRGTRRG